MEVLGATELLVTISGRQGWADKSESPQPRFPLWWSKAVRAAQCGIPGYIPGCEGRKAAVSWPCWVTRATVQVSPGIHLADGLPVSGEVLALCLSSQQTGHCYKRFENGSHEKMDSV